YKTWRRPILFETGERLYVRDGQVFLGEKPISLYTFRSDWYFLGGDNVLNSKDSRYIGLFPESYIIGIVI
ncbi:MAG: S26 family signal peptidase, partial [Bacteroidales bacterium]|nr:S26 family signal peptidase [Bacteroidales bacterium]